MPKSSSALRVGDLVEVPELRTVVRLGDVDDAAEATSLASSFVFSDDAVRALRLLRRAFAQATGQGFFLIGSYGSGKSHLMAVLAVWVEAGPAAALDLPIDDDLGGPAIPKRLLAVRTSLVEHRGSEALEECVLAAAERQFSLLGRDLALTPARQHLARLEAALSTAERERLEVGLVERGLAPLAELGRSNPREAVTHVRELLAEAGIALPEQLHDERAQLFARIDDEARELGYQGVLLLIDELSEFLRAKPTSRALSEDARFLQFLGERGRNQPMWVVASLQEALEETGDLARPVLDKIKDRFPVRLRLSATHVEELIDGRLIRKLPAAKDALPEIHRGLMAHFPDLKLSAERFARIYPLHPQTLAYLTGLSDLFSQARGVVEFVASQVRGDPLQEIPGLLGADATTLLGVESIFDHFESRLREHESFSPYYSRAYRHLYKCADELFTDPEEHALAVRLIKVLVLTEVNPLENRKTVKELAETLLTRTSDLDPSLNYRYLGEVILERLHQAADYLRREVSDEPFGDRYGLDLALDVRSLLQQRIATKLKLAQGEEPRVLRRLLTEVGGGLLPLDRLARGERVVASVRWLNTDRQADLVFGEPCDLEPVQLQKLLERLDGDVDCLVFVRQPAVEPRPLPAEVDRTDVLLWTPGEVSDDALGELMTAAAQHALLLESRGSTEEELRLRDLASEEVEKGAARVRELLAGLYFGGAITPASSRQGLLPLEVSPQTRSLEDALEPAVARALNECHPEFRRVMPQTSYVNPRALAQVLNELSANPVSSTTARQRGTLSVIDSVLVPLGLVQLKRGSYVLSPDDATGSVTHATLAEIAEHDGMPYAAVYQMLRKGPFGLPDLLARTVLLGVLLAGQLVGQRNGKTQSPQFLSYETLPTLESLNLGTLLDPGHQQELRSLSFLFKETLPEFWGIKTQKDVWQTLLKFRERTTERFAKLAEATARFRELGALSGLDWGRLERATQPIRELAVAVHPSYGSRRGIECVIEAQREVALGEGSLRALKNIERFFADRVEKVLFIHGYVMDPALDEVAEATKADVAAIRSTLASLTEVVLGGTSDVLEERFERFRSAHQALYVAAHDEQVGERAFAELDAIGQSIELRALDAMRVVEDVAVEHDHARLRRTIEQAMQRRCRRDAAADVYTRATCTCGFRLGEKVPKPSIAELKARARDGIVAYAGEFAQPEHRARILAHAAALEGSEREASSVALRKLVRALDKGAQAKNLLLMLDRPLGETLAEALRGSVPVVERHLRDWVSGVAERKLSVATLRDSFERWLDAASLADGTLVHVVDPVEPTKRSTFVAPKATPLAGIDGDPRRRRPRRGPLLARGLRAWASVRGLDVDEVARLLQLESAEVDDASATLAELGPDLDELLARDAALAGAVVDVLELDRLDAAALAAELDREPCLESVRARVLDRLTTRVLAREATARSLPSRREPIPPPVSGLRVSVRELYELVRVGLVAAEDEDPTPADLLDGLLHLDAASTLATRTGALEPPTVRALLDLAARLEQRAAATPPTTVEMLPPLLTTLDPKQRTLVLVIDALRYDLWRALAPTVAELLGRAVTRDELRLAPAASTTEAARAHLFGSDGDPETTLRARGIGFLVAAERDHRAIELQRALEGVEHATRVVWLNLLDEKIHASSLSPWGMVEAVATELRGSLAGAVERIPEGDRVIVIADHGFRENGAWPKVRERYIHGGNTLLERAVPFAELG